MIYYLCLPLMTVFLIVLQMTLADILFSGWLTLELSLIAMIYAGFRLSLVKGLMLAAMTGFILDCVSGAPLGLFTLIYLLIFSLSFFVSPRMASGKFYLIALFSFFCCMMESLIVMTIYRLALGHEMPDHALLIFIPQALLLSVVAVGFFSGMRILEGWMDGKSVQSPQRP